MGTTTKEGEEEREITIEPIETPAQPAEKPPAPKRREPEKVPA